MQAGSHALVDVFDGNNINFGETIHVCTLSIPLTDHHVTRQTH